MLGGANKPTLGLLGTAAASVCLLAIPPVSGADRAPAIQRLQAESANLAAKSRSAVLELYSLDARLASARSRLGTLEATAVRLRAESASIDRQIRLARLDTRVSQARLAARLRFIYEHGTASSLDVIMGAKTIQEALTQLDDVNRITAANADVLAQVQSAQTHLTRLKHELASRRRALAVTTAQLGATVSEVGQEQAQQSAYVAGLARRRTLDAARIARLQAQAQAAVARSRAEATARAATQAETSTLDAQPAAPGQPPVLTSPVTPAPSASVAPGNGRALTVVATGYDLPGRTSTGLPTGWGVAAVDPSVIPLGTHLVIPGYGVAIAADTGSAVVGARIDLWFPTAAQAYAWGRRTITISLG